MRRSGIVVQTDKGEFAIAYHSEQRVEFGKRLYLHFFSDRLCMFPIMVDGKKKSALKDISKCKQIGFVD